MGEGRVEDVEGLEEHDRVCVVLLLEQKGGEDGDDAPPARDGPEQLGGVVGRVAQQQEDEDASGDVGDLGVAHRGQQAPEDAAQLLGRGEEQHAVEGGEHALEEAGVEGAVRGVLLLERRWRRRGWRRRG